MSCITTIKINGLTVTSKLQPKILEILKDNPHLVLDEVNYFLEDNDKLDSINQLTEDHYEEIAGEYYNHFLEEDFINSFGNWQNSDSSINQNNIYVTGEPKLHFDKSLKKWYYRDKYANKVFYPFEQNGLNFIYPNEAITEGVKFLAYKFFQSNFNKDYNNLNFVTKDSLKETIRMIINQKINETKDTDRDYIADELRESLFYLDEWVDKVRNYFYSLNFKVEDVEAEVITEEENSTSELIRTSSFEKNSKDAVGANVKAFLSFIPNTDEVDIIFEESGFVDFDDIWNTLQKELANLPQTVVDGNIEDGYELMLSKIQELALKKTYFKELLNILNQPNLSEEKKSEFFQAFSLAKNPFFVTEVKINDKGLSFDVKDVSNVNTKEKTIKNEWGLNFNSLFINENNKVEFDKVKSVQTDLETLKSDLSILLKVIDNKNQLDRPINKLLKIFRDLGVETTEKAFNSWIDINSSQDAIIEKLVNTINNTNRLTKDIISRNVNPLKSNVFNSQSLFLDLAKEEAFFLEDGSDSSIFSSGKTYWTFSYPSYLHNEVNSWKRNRNELEKIYLEKGNESSELLKYLLGYDQKWSNDELRIQESNKRINSFKIGVFNVLQEKKEDGITSDPKNNVQLSKDDSIADIVNKSLLKKIGQRSIFNTPTPADKATSYLIQHGLFIDNNTDFNLDSKKPTVSGEVVNIFYNYFQTEYDRMRSEYDVVNDENSTKVVHYHTKNDRSYDNNGFLTGNAFKSQIFPSLSFDKIDSKSPLYNKLYGANGQALLDSLSKYENIIKDHIENVISQEIMNTHQTLVHKGVFQISEDGIVGGYVNKAIDNRIFNGYAENSLYPTLAIAGDFYVNSTMNLIEYSKLFSGDPAYYKNMVDYAKRIPATYTDGLPLRLLNNDELFFNAAVISGVEIDSPYIKELTELVGEDIANMYKKVNTTDAQAWITPNRWEFIVKRTGIWKDSLHQGAYDKMMGLNKDPFTVEELKAVAQPLKGVYFKKNNGVPVFLKYSQAVLLPGLIKGSQLENLYNKMVDNDIQEVITIDGVKVGATTPDTIHDSKGNILDNFELTPLQLDNRGWKLQQNIPTKTFKDTTVGSQIQKNALAGLAFNLDNNFKVQDKDKTGLEMYKSINSIIGRLSEIGVEQLIDELGLDNNNKITNPKALYSLLIKEAKNRNVNDNLIDALQKELSIYGIPQAHKKLLNMFFSITNNRLVKIKTNGGSMIQISNFGLDKVDNIKTAGIKWFIDPEKGLKPPHIITNEEGKEVIKPGQVLLPGSMIAKYIPNWKEIPADKLKKMIDPEILDSIIGYRIPNQGLSSNDALEIVGFLPEGMGDAVVAYSEIPTKTGSDFDIDKMYIMIPSFESNSKNELKYIRPVLDENGKELDIEYQPKEVVQNMLIQHYKSIFTNKNVIKDIMTPIDHDHLEKDIKTIRNESSKKKDLHHFDVTNQINLKYLFISTQAGVGQYANQMMDHVRGMFTESSLLGTYIGWGHKNAKNETLFDRQYSENLNDEDAKYIVEVVNNNYKNDSSHEPWTVNDVRNYKIADSLSAALNGNVDAANNPFIADGNYVTQTNGPVAMMLRAGMHPMYVNRFIGQPVIKDYIDFVNYSESKINKNTGDLQTKFKKELVNRKLKDKSIKIGDKEISYIQLNNNFRYQEPTIGAVAKKFKDYKSTEHKGQIQEFLDELMEVKLMFKNDLIPVQTLSLQDLTEQITKEDDFTIQWSVLQEFFKLQELSKNLVGSINASKVDVNGAGKDLSSRFVSENLINNMIESEKMETTGSIIGFKDKLIDPNTNEETILGHYVNNSISFVNDILKDNPKLFLMSNENIEKTFNKISNELKNENLMSQTLADRLYSSYYSYLMSGFKPLKSENYVQDLFKDLSTKVLKAKSESDNYFLQQLEIVEERGYNFIKLDNRKRSKSNQNKMYLGWKDLMNEFPEISDQLVQYSFYQSGFQNNINEFFSHIPHEYFAENNLNQFIFESNKRIGNIQLKFIDQFYRNNWQDGLIVPNIFANQIKSLHKGVSFTLDNPENISQPRFVKLDNTLAELVGYATSGNGIYFKTYKLGQDLNNGKIYEYSFDKNITSKILTNIPNNIKEIEKIKSEFEPTFGIEYFDKNNNVVETEEEINNEQQNEEFIDPLSIEENINPSDKSEC